MAPYRFLLLITLSALGSLHAQVSPAPWLTWTNPAKNRPKVYVDFSESSRLGMLTRGNLIYLTLQDAIALALENNLDIEAARYLPKIAAADQLRAAAGEFIRSTPTTVAFGPNSASGTLSVAGPLASAANSGGSQVGLSPSTTVEASGTSLPKLDPFIFASGSFGHQSLPQANTVLTGTNALNSDLRQWNYGVQKSFITGGTISFSWDNTKLKQNAPNNDLNPATIASAGLDFRQPLLRGFGKSLNSRVIKIARNNRDGADLTFRAQVIATLYNVINLYYDLVAFHDQLRVRRTALEISQRIFNDNKREAAIGSLAAAELDRSQVEVFAAEQDVASGETQVLQQEMLLKTVLTRNGIDSLALEQARLIPLDHFVIPEQETTDPTPELVAKAMANRPELRQSELQTENKVMGLAGTRDALRPSLDLTVSLRNNGLAGSLNSATPAAGAFRNVDPFFLGDYGTAVKQLLGRNFPDYLVGFSLNIPIGNRAAKADLARDEYDLRLQQIGQQRLRNAIKLDVLNARLAVAKAREAYLASKHGRELAERNYNTEQRKMTLGASTTLEVILARRDLTVRQIAEVTALNTYARAKNGMSAISGDLLRDYSISLDEAFTGVVNREPDLPPATDKTDSVKRNIP